MVPRHFRCNALTLVAWESRDDRGTTPFLCLGQPSCTGAPLVPCRYIRLQWAWLRAVIEGRKPPVPAVTQGGSFLSVLRCCGHYGSSHSSKLFRPPQLDIKPRSFPHGSGAGTPNGEPDRSHALSYAHTPLSRGRSPYLSPVTPSGAQNVAFHPAKTNPTGRNSVSHSLDISAMVPQNPFIAQGKKTKSWRM